MRSRWFRSDRAADSCRLDGRRSNPSGAFPGLPAPGRRRLVPRGVGRGLANRGRPRDEPPRLGRGLARTLWRPDPGNGGARPGGGPAWRDLAPWLARAELRGSSVVAILSRTPRAFSMPRVKSPRRWPRWPRRRDPNSEFTMISSLDPANLYGSGAPLDIDLLEGGTARLPRNPSNFPGPSRWSADLDHRRRGKLANGARPRPPRPICVEQQGKSPVSPDLRDGS